MLRMTVQQDGGEQRGVTWIDGPNEGESNVGGVEGVQTPEGVLEEIEGMVVKCVNENV